MLYERFLFGVTFICAAIVKSEQRTDNQKVTYAAKLQEGERSMGQAQPHSQGPLSTSTLGDIGAKQQS